MENTPNDDSPCGAAASLTESPGATASLAALQIFYFLLWKWRLNENGVQNSLLFSDQQPQDDEDDVLDFNIKKISSQKVNKPSHQLFSSSITK